MLKTLLALTILSLAFLLLPMSSFGPVTTFGAAGLSPAHAIDIDLGDYDGEDDDDDGPDDDDDDDEDDED